MIEGHGDDTYVYGGAVRYNFSSNILSGVDHEALANHLSHCASLIAAYPEPVPVSLEAMLAGRLGVSSGNVMVTNGATEAIYLIAHAFAGADSQIVVPTFSEYEDACALYGHNVDFADWDSFWQGEGTDIGDKTTGADVPGCVWLCNPNNPTGRTVDVNRLRMELAANPNTLYVIDQAYADYTSKPVFTAGETVECGNVILLGSFTKRYSVPGLRVGYAVGGDKIMARVRAFRMPWSVSGIAIEGAKFLLGNSGMYRIDCGSLHSEALRLTDALRTLGIEVMDTDCNFMLCCLPDGTAHELKEWLVTHHGILIRDASNFHGLTDRHFRVAAQTREDNEILIAAIKGWIAR